MTSPRLAALRGQFDQVRAGIDTIEARATDETRDLTDAEQAEVDTLYTRAETLKGEIEPLADRQRSIDATADVLSRLGAARPAPQAHARTDEALPTAAEYMAAHIRSLRDGTADAQEHFRSLHARTVADTILSDTPGLLPVPLVGEVIKLSDSLRPVFASMTSRPMPAAGKTFRRPYISQRVGMGEQTTEMTEVTSQTFQVSSDDVSKRTFAGVLELSQQDLDWTDPAVMGLVLSDFSEMYSEVTEGEACDHLEDLALASGNVREWQPLSVAGVVQSFTDAALDIYADAKRLPNTIWISLDRWGQLASMTNAYDQLVFPTLGSGVIDLTDNTIAGTPLGFRVVTGPQFASGTTIVGCRELVESYEQRKGTLTLAQPSVLGYQVGYYGYVAFHGKAAGFARLVDLHS